jgi:undecaprenyl-diphosphatase
MSPTSLQIILLGLIQGAAEMLPVSSSAHVIVAEKLMGLNPSSPDMTFLLVMLHTGSMAAFIVYFWKAWRKSYFSSTTQFMDSVRHIAVATIGTLIVGWVLKVLIEKIVLGGGQNAEIEQLFSSLPLIAAALFVAGLLIIVSAFSERKNLATKEQTLAVSGMIGIVQGVCVPFRGLSRSGCTISAGMLAGIGRRRAEEFSFALAVVVTPLAIAKELYRLLQTAPETKSVAYVGHLLQPAMVGMIGSFLAALLALRWLSRWLETGRWQRFGYYCLVASVVIFALVLKGV